jgi:DNA polymerase V
MRAYGIFTAYDLVQRSDAFIRQHLRVVGLRIKHELLGVSCLEVDNQPTSKKSILTSRSFSKPLSDIYKLSEALANYTSSCAQKLRKQSSCAQTIMVFINTNKYKKDKPQYSNYLSMHLPVATSDTSELIVYAKDLLKKIFREGYDYNKLGVMLSDIIPFRNVQGNLFDTLDRGKQGKLMQVMDNLNKYNGKGSLRMASQGENRALMSKQEKLSPEYTTKWRDILQLGEKEL